MNTEHPRVIRTLTGYKAQQADGSYELIPPWHPLYPKGA